MPYRNPSHPPPAPGCPRCGQPLIDLAVTDGSAWGCQACSGVWLDDAAFGAVRQKAYASIVRTAGARPPPTARYGGVTLKCPVCANPLTKTELAEVTVDHCSEHGTWFDRGELEAVASAISLAKARALTGNRESALAPPQSGRINPETLARVQQLNAQLSIEVDRAEASHLMHQLHRMQMYRRW